VPPNRPQRPREAYPSRGSIRPTYLTLRDHGKVFVADLPRLSDGQLAHVGKEAREVLDSLSRRLEELEQQLQLSPLEQETRIRAATKRDRVEVRGAHGRISRLMYVGILSMAFYERRKLLVAVYFQYPVEPRRPLSRRSSSSS
jgi:hypothetical protein